MTPAELAAVATRPPELVLVAGPNGSGKSTIAEAYVHQRFPLVPKINADRLLLALQRANALEPTPNPALQAAQMVDVTATCLALLHVA